jgi:hypothetical protein
MSAPDTNTRKESERHRGPLTGMFAVVLFAVVMFAILGFWAFGRGNNPEGGAGIDDRTGGDSGDDTTAIAEEVAPLVQPEELTGADPSSNEQPDTLPTETQVSTPPGAAPQPEVSADD